MRVILARTSILPVGLSAQEYAPLVPITRKSWTPCRIAGDLLSVGPRVLARRERVLSINERSVLRLEHDGRALALVMVGALNVGRIRVVGVEPGADAPPGGLALERGGELARFEMGSTVVLLTPPGGWEPLPGLEPGAALRLGQPIGAPAG